MYGAYFVGEGRFQGVKCDRDYMALQFSFYNKPITMMQAMASGKFEPVALHEMVSLASNFKRHHVFLTHTHNFESWCYIAKDPRNVFYLNFHGVTEDEATA